MKSVLSLGLTVSKFLKSLDDTIFPRSTLEQHSLEYLCTRNIILNYMYSIYSTVIKRLWS